PVLVHFHPDLPDSLTGYLLFAPVDPDTITFTGYLYMYKKFIVHRLYSFNSAMHLSTSRTNFDNLILALFISPSLTETTRAVSMLSHLAFNSSIVFIAC